jgi:hypothetical protein
VPKDLYAVDLKNAVGHELSDEEVDQRYKELMLEVEVVQLEETALLRCLIKNHGLRRIFAEGLTPQDLPNYKETIALLRDMEKNQIAPLRKQLSDVRDLLKRTTPGTDRFHRAKKIESEINEMTDQHKVRSLEIGAAGRLLIAGEMKDVLPLDDADLLEESKPISPQGEFSLDPSKLKARHDAQIRTVLERGTFGLIMLGAGHDLSDSVRRLDKDECEYIRVTTRRVKDFSQ